jgi:hypothetical protein
MKLLKAVFSDKFDQLQTLYYRIYDTELSARWTKLTKQNQLKDKQLFSKFTNRTWKELPEVTTNLNAIVSSINNLYDQALPVYNELDTEKLNYLHEQFEVYGDRITLLQTDSKWSDQLHQLFLRLNEAIHLTEDVIKTKSRPWPSFAMLYDYVPQELHLPIKDEDMFLLRPNLQWGKLYLGYNTLGKDWIKVQCDNDIEVVEREQVRPQERFAAEAWLNFGPEQDYNTCIMRFYQWYRSLPEDLQAKVPMHDLNKLRLGRFVLGELVIDDYFLAFHENEEDWHTPRHPCKIKWNLEVFSTFRSLVKIELIE